MFRRWRQCEGEQTSGRQLAQSLVVVSHQLCVYVRACAQEALSDLVVEYSR
jgi:hypothetical protein